MSLSYWKTIVKQQPGKLRQRAAIESQVTCSCLDISASKMNTLYVIPKFPLER